MVRVQEDRRLGCFCVEVYLDVELQSGRLSVADSSVMNLTGWSPPGLPGAVDCSLLFVRERPPCYDALVERVGLLRRRVELDSYVGQEGNLSGPCVTSLALVSDCSTCRFLSLFWFYTDARRILHLRYCGAVD